MSPTLRWLEGRCGPPPSSTGRGGDQPLICMWRYRAVDSRFRGKGRMNAPELRMLLVSCTVCSREQLRRLSRRVVRNYCSRGFESVLSATDYKTEDLECRIASTVRVVDRCEGNGRGALAGSRYAWDGAQTKHKNGNQQEVQHKISHLVVYKLFADELGYNRSRRASSQSIRSSPQKFAKDFT